MSIPLKTVLYVVQRKNIHIAINVLELASPKSSMCQLILFANLPYGPNVVSFLCQLLHLHSIPFSLITVVVSFYSQGNVEVWLNTLLKESRASLHSVIQTASIAIKDSAFKLKDFLDAYPAQVKINCEDNYRFSNVGRKTRPKLQ